MSWIEYIAGKLFHYHPMEAYESIHEAGRMVGANIPNEWILYAASGIPIIVFMIGFYLRYRTWSLANGKKMRFDQIGARISSLFKNSIFQARLFKKPFPGIMHALLFWGFFVLMMAAGVDALHYWVGWPHVEGASYIGFSAVVDLFGLAALVGIICLAYIRYIQKPERLNDTISSDGWILLFIFVILLTGFLIEGARISMQVKMTSTLALAGGEYSWDRIASPAGWYFQYIFNWMSLDAVGSWHRIMWWFHAALAFTFIAIVPFTKLWHIFAAMLNHYFRDLEPSACTLIENIDEAETFGVENLEEYSWKDFLDFDTCIRCGRCQEVCPAYNTGKHLNPKVTLIQALKKHMDAKAPYLLEAKKNPAVEEEVAMTHEEPAEDVNPTELSLLYDVVTTDVIWDCTNCRACMEACPMYIEHIPKLIELRRNLVMWQGDMLSEAQMAFTNMERNYNPWGVGYTNRAGWLDERGVREKVNLVPEDGKEFEYLLYGGCAVAFDDRYKKVGEALVNLLDKAGVSFGYLGVEEYCCGDSARRLGNEYLYQTLANMNIESFNNYGVKKIIVVCPHGFNALKNEYPQLGGTYEVYHYTEILAQLIAAGKLKGGKALGARAAYHDSCFLGRHNNIYDDPRTVLATAGANVTEHEKGKSNGFCCGAGGGRMWLEEHATDPFKRINDTRADQMLEVDPEMIVTNCPFCLTMLSDGVKSANAEENVKVFDVAEVLWQSFN